MKLAITLSLETADAIINDVLSTARHESMLPLTVVVLDSGGKLIAMKSEDGSGLLRFDVAFGKAWGSLGMGISSRAIRDKLSARPAFQNSLMAASDGQMIPVPGGVLIEDSHGTVLGAVGISGDTSEKDEYCAITAVHKLGFCTEPADVDVNWRDSKLSDLEQAGSAR
jgi:uncharacterized protein GlcG (DUF336 family)